MMRTTLFSIFITLPCLAFFIYLLTLLVRALRKYLRSEPVRKEKREVCQSLGEAIKAHRTRCKMTQEFVAEHLGVSRQRLRMKITPPRSAIAPAAEAVSKWESGTSDPSTSNLLALAKLFGVSAKELLDNTAE